ncbi:MAG: amidohydrolase family protein [Dehalococcoidia bacterium]
MHLAQSRAELEQVRNLHPGTSAEYLKEYGFVGPDVIAAHWSFCNGDDIALLADTNTSIAHCPTSSSRRGTSGGAPIPQIEDAGVNISLGTDNMSEDMFEALRFGLMLNRGKRGNGERPAPADLFRWATRNGARALGREDDLGSLEPGKKADLCIVNVRKAHLTPMLNPLATLVHYGQGSDVEAVMVDGAVMQDGKVLTMNEDDVIRNAQEAAAAAWKRFHAANPDLPVPAWVV